MHNAAFPKWSPGQLRAAFAALFDPALLDEHLKTAAETWREQHLSATALARTDPNHQAVANINGCPTWAKWGSGQVWDSFP
jgi:hypothetical protein